MRSNIPIKLGKYYKDREDRYYQIISKHPVDDRDNPRFLAVLGRWNYDVYSFYIDGEFCGTDRSRDLRNEILAEDIAGNRDNRIRKEHIE